MDEYLSFAKSLAKEAGEIMLKYFRLGMEHKIKEDLSFTTKADEEINELIIKRITKKYPDHSILGEEASAEKESEFVWQCDPVDGTVPFAKGLAVSVFSLALVKDGVPQLGVVLDPFNKRLYSAVKDNGAYVNDEKIFVSKTKLGRNMVINLEWWPEADYELEIPMHNLSVDTKAYVFRLGSVISASCLVAAGQYEACVFAGTKGKSLDIAAVKVIVEEAGGKVTDLFGSEQRYDRDIKGAILSNGIVHEDILKYTRNLNT